MPKSFKNKLDNGEIIPRYAGGDITSQPSALPVFSAVYRNVAAVMGIIRDFFHAAIMYVEKRRTQHAIDLN